MGWIGFEDKEETPKSVAGLSECLLGDLGSGMGSNVGIIQVRSPAVHLIAAIPESWE